MDRSNKILWVDDNTSFLRLIFESMKDNGDEDVCDSILFAENGNEAVRLYIEYRPMLVFMDILMPGIDGIKCAEMIRDVDPGANISLVSNYSNDKRAIDAIKNHLANSRVDKGVGIGALAGMTAFIIKTISKVI